MSQAGLGYSVMRIFIVLFVLTAIEVLFGMAFREPRWLLWSGLLICAFLKGLLIFMYFMHMKFEKYLVWSLIAPTPLLVGVVVFALMPDVSFNGLRDHPVGDQLNEQGRIVDLRAGSPAHGSAHGGSQEGDAGH